MKLKRISIERYGPLNQVSLKLGEGVQPILGGNETGKTLCVDALLKMVTGERVGWDISLDRVEESPEGFVVFEEDGNEVKLEKSETLTDHLEIDSREFRNILVIRDSDLSIPEEDFFYERVMDRITGLRSTGIRKIAEKLIELGRLTSGKKEISDASACGKAASNLNEAKELGKDIKEYIEKAEKTGVSEIEAEVFEAKSAYNKFSSEIELQEKAKDKKGFLKLETNLEESNVALRSLGNFPNEQKTTSLGNRLKELEEEEKKRPHFERVRYITQKLSYLALLSVAATWIVSLIFGLTGIQGLAIPLILLIVFVTILFVYFWSSWQLSAIENQLTSLITECQDIEIQGETISELKKSLDDLRDTKNKITTSLDQNIGVLRDALAIEEKAREEVLKKASDALSEKKTSIDFEVTVEFDEGKLRGAKEKLAETEEKINTLNQALIDHNDVIKGFSGRAHKLDFRTFMGKELELEIENLESLKFLDKELEKFENEIENLACLCREAVNIFEELEDEEEAKISELFGENSTTTMMFKQITEGRYGEVRYNHENKIIEVRRPSGISLPADKLSKGAFDQLYLSIRIDLAQRLLGRRKGFFIMDDAFLSSDKKRFQEQLNLLKKVSEMGWQTIYFTVKAEDSQALGRISGNKIIKLKPLP